MVSSSDDTTYEYTETKDAVIKIYLNLDKELFDLYNEEAWFGSYDYTATGISNTKSCTDYGFSNPTISEEEGVAIRNYEKDSGAICWERDYDKSNYWGNIMLVSE